MMEKKSEAQIARTKLLMRRDTQSVYSSNDLDVSCSTLCSRCSAIPWATLVYEPEYRRTRLFDVPNPAEVLQRSSCPSCRIFACSLLNLDTPISKVAYRNSVVEYGDKSGKSWFSSSLKLRRYDRGSLRELYGNYLGDSASLTLLSGIPQYMNFVEAKSWIQTCVSGHEHCKPEPSNTLSDLKVLDCHTRTIVSAPESCLFVALSYVWGQPAPHPEPMDVPNFPALPCVLPRTVGDSIEATKMLGYRYLWVDRYCIDQKNPDDQHRQISQMGTIYSSAQFTIVAAAGTDANAGLPGVSCAFTNPKICSVTKDLCLVALPQSVTQSVSGSAWYSRAWTLQEGYLSKRRLFFVEHGAEFICDQDLQDKGLLVGHVAKELAASLPSTITSWDRANHMMRQFTGRSLTYDTDALNAIVGALETLEGVDNTMGVVISSSNASKTSSIQMALSWHHPIPCSRRKGFPSWSPIGWRGHVDYLDHQTIISSGCRLEVWYNGRYRLLSETIGRLSRQHRAHEPEQAKFLRLKTIVVMLDFEDLDESPNIPAGLYVKIPYNHDLTLLVQPLWDVESVYQTHEHGLQLACAVLVRRRTLMQTTWRCERETQIIIMQPLGTHYERVGCFDLNWSYRNILARDKQGRTFPLDFSYGNPLLEYGDGTFWMETGEERTFLLG